MTWFQIQILVLSVHHVVSSCDVTKGCQSIQAARRSQQPPAELRVLTHAHNMWFPCCLPPRSRWPMPLWEQSAVITCHDKEPAGGWKDCYVKKKTGANKKEIAASLSDFLTHFRTVDDTISCSAPLIHQHVHPHPPFLSPKMCPHNFHYGNSLKSFSPSYAIRSRVPGGGRRIVCRPCWAASLFVAEQFVFQNG